MPRQGSTDPKKSDLLAQHAGGFSPEVRAAFRSDPALVSEIATRLLKNHFPESIHPDILAAVGLSLGVDGGRRSGAIRSSGSGCLPLTNSAVSCADLTCA
jgi:putative restriction endonuclease